MDAFTTKILINAACLAVASAIAFPFILKANKKAQRLSVATSFIGNLPKSPKPITVDLDRETTIRRFVQGLNSVEINQSWAIKDHGLQSGFVKAEMRLTSSYSSEDLIDSLNSTNQYLTLKAEFITRGRGCMIVWSYEKPAQPFPDQLIGHAQRHPVSQPTGEKDCAETNFHILQALGVLDGSVQVIE